MDYDFSGLGTRRFESVVKAIALEVLGPGASVFGAGSDGGREAIFEGEVPFPSTIEKWNGYIVVQAKYKERLEDTSKDADWLISQLRGELKKFLDESRQLRKPEYYIIATNVPLSSVVTRTSKSGQQVAGGIVKVEDYLRTWIKELGLKDFHIWGYSQIAAYLDVFEGIRNRNAAFITTSDVIVQVIESLAPSTRFFEVIHRAMCSHLLANQYVRLRDAGHSAVEPIRVCDVFVDLPLEDSDALRELLSSDGDARTRGRPLVLASLLKVLNSSLDAYGDRFIDAPSRIVLKGGPGQGKSTIGQFLVQGLQSRLLVAKGAPQLAPDVQKIVQAVNGNALARNIRAFRFPILIQLPVFADRISAKTDIDRYTVLHEIVRTINRDAAPSNVSPESIRIWLQRYPWFVVLDGLDEVPPGDVRLTLISEIKSFNSELAQAQSDTVVVVTTREQNYRDELDKDFWDNWTLAQLDSSEALDYAGALTRYLIPGTEERTRVMSVLSEAGSLEMTRRLMVSPLQVTILVALIDLRGTLPGDRWQLFNRYFHVLREREEQKGAWFSPILKAQRRVIEDIHFLSGFLLHTRGERSGGGVASFTRDEFRDLVKSRFLAEDEQGDGIEGLITAIDLIATQRLVLLSTRVTGHVAFDIRSIQEYAAAALITSGEDRVVRLRLRAISGSSHWTHVFQIAASRCFSETSFNYLRDEVVAICRSLDDGQDDPRYRMVLLGAKLAFRLLQDDLAADAPNYRGQLFSHALEYLRRGPSEEAGDLARLVNNAVQLRCREELVALLPNVGSPQSIAAWHFVFELSNQGYSWASENILEFWPHDKGLSLSILAHVGRSFLDSNVRVLVDNTIESCGFRMVEDKLSYSWASHTAFRRRRESKSSFESTYKLSFRYAFFEQRSQVPLFVRGRRSGIVLSYIPLGINCDAFEGLDSLEGDAWAPIREVSAFCQAPSKDQLKSALLFFKNAPRDAIVLESAMPWPLASVVRSCNSESDFASAAESAEAGIYGDSSVWLAAEERWRKNGFNEADISVWEPTERWGTNLSTVGMPLAVEFDVSRRVEKDVLVAIVTAILTLSPPAQLKILDGELQSLLYDRIGELDAEGLALECLDVLGRDKRTVGIFLSKALNEISLQSAAILQKLEEISSHAAFFPIIWGGPSVGGENVREKVNRYPGLLPIVIADCLSRGDKNSLLEFAEFEAAPALQTRSEKVAMFCIRLLGGALGNQGLGRFADLLLSVGDEEAGSYLPSSARSTLEALLQVDHGKTDALIRIVAEKLPSLDKARGFAELIETALSSKLTEMTSLDSWNAMKLPVAYFGFTEAAKKRSEFDHP